MKRKIILMIVVLLSIGSAMAAGSWETGEMPYIPCMDGSVCWTTTRVFKDGTRSSEPLFHSMDLSTGKIQTRALGDWYLIQTDFQHNGTLIVREIDGKLQVAEWTSAGKWVAFGEYPFESTYSFWDYNIQQDVSRSVLAYLDGYFYYLASDGETTWIRRDDMQGEYYDYVVVPYYLPTFSPSGNLFTVFTINNDRNCIIETTDGNIFIPLEKKENLTLTPVVWIDDECILVWATDLDERSKDPIHYASEMNLYRWTDDSLTPVLSNAGTPVVATKGSGGFSYSYDPETERVVQLIYWAEDFYCVPTVMNISDGTATFIAETEHTSEYDEYCRSWDVVAWLIAR